VSANYAAKFAILSAAAIIAAVYADADAARRDVLVWVAAAFALVATAYATGNPRLLMKRLDGSRPIWSWIILWPYFSLVYASYWVHRFFSSRNPGIAEVVPGLWFSRRPAGREAHAAVLRWAGVLDLTAEFPKASVDTDAYRCLPLLDGTEPTEAQLRDGAAWIGQRLVHGPVLVHCALGHGRTGCMVLMWLLANGHVGSVEEGTAKLKALRRGFGLSRGQAVCVADAAKCAAQKQAG
jgi:hypothetical protein